MLKTKIKIFILITLLLAIGFIAMGCTYVDYEGIIVDKYKRTWIQSVYTGKSIVCIPRTSYYFLVEYELGEKEVKVSLKDYEKYNKGDAYTISVCGD